jgi:hypothetical protein
MGLFDLIYQISRGHYPTWTRLILWVIVIPLLVAGAVIFLSD